MMFNKFLVVNKYLAFCFLLISLLEVVFCSSTIAVFDDSLGKTSNLSIVPVSFDTNIVYRDDLVYDDRNVVTQGVFGYALEDSGTIVVSPVDEVIEIGRGPVAIFYGSTTGYGADCVGCSGNVACRSASGSHNLITDGIYYNDSKYGLVRIIAADNSNFSCGTIMEVDNGIIDPFMAIVLDTGSAMRSAALNGNILIDIAFLNENSIGINDATNKSGNVKFGVYRYGW